MLTPKQRQAACEALDVHPDIFKATTIDELKHLIVLNRQRIEELETKLALCHARLDRCEKLNQTTKEKNN